MGTWASSLLVGTYLGRIFIGSVRTAAHFTREGWKNPTWMVTHSYLSFRTELARSEPSWTCSDAVVVPAAESKH